MTSQETKANTLSRPQSAQEDKMEKFPKFYGSHPVKIFVFREDCEDFEIYWYLNDVLRVLNNNSNRKSVLRKLSSYVVDLIDSENNGDVFNHMYQFNASTETWSTVNMSELHSSTRTSMNSKLSAIPNHCLLECIQLIQSKMRITTSQKMINLKKFYTDEDLNKVQITESPIELSCLDVLEKTLPFEMICQHRIGVYRIDAYIPRFRIGIQIDENDHSGYDENNEKKINQCLNDNNITCIRFSPNNNLTPTENGFKLVKLFWQKFISIEYRCFRSFNMLT